MTPRSTGGVAAALPALVLVPVLTLQPTAGPLVADPVTAYAPPVPGQVAREFDPPAHEWEAGHRGVDLWSARGADVHSPGPGVVSFAGSVGGKPVVTVTHPDGLRSSLEPVDGALPVGTAVATGTVVGQLAATTGDGSNPDHCAALTPPGAGSGAGSGSGAACLHWGVRRGEVYLDPLTLLGDAPPIVLLPPLDSAG